jgi:hypothetical protein
MLGSMLAADAEQFNPEAKNHDLPYIARHTGLLSDLVKIYTHNPTMDEGNLFRQHINMIQQALYPWITASKDGNSAYGSLFDLVNSWTQDVGIVMSVGRIGFRWAVHQIVMLRSTLNCELPIEIFYAGDDDLPENYRRFIQAIELAFPGSGSISIFDINQRFPDPDGTLALPGNWAMRPFCILASSFKTAILVDSDAVFLLDPAVLTEEPGFESHGSIFWHDRYLERAPEDLYDWVDSMLERAKAKNLVEVHANSKWFRRESRHEMERLHSKCYSNF